MDIMDDMIEEVVDDYLQNLQTQQKQEYNNWRDQFALQIKEKAKFYNDFPKKGVTFLDIFSLTSDPEFFKELNKGTVKIIEREIEEQGLDFNAIIGLESRGFIQGPILAQHFKVPFIPIRKAGKLPGECFKQAYGTEYSLDVCEI